MKLIEYDAARNKYCPFSGLKKGCESCDCMAWEFPNGGNLGHCKLLDKEESFPKPTLYSIPSSMIEEK